MNTKPERIYEATAESKRYEKIEDLIADIGMIRLNHLRTSVFPGATDAGILMAVDYCNRKKYDYEAKCVHIIEMSYDTGQEYFCAKSKKNKPVYGKREVLMPGIPGYRIDATRTGVYMGLNAPVIGELKKHIFTDNYNDNVSTFEFEFPEWIEITVKRLVAGVICEFTAREYWLENYAKKAYWSTHPNTMWMKRTIGQLAKCAEAQALRKAFPDVIAAMATFDEMEGKIWDLSADDYEVVDEESTQKPKKAKSKMLLEKHKKSDLEQGLADLKKTPEEIKIEEMQIEVNEILNGVEPKQGAKEQAIPSAPDSQDALTFKELKTKIAKAKTIAEVQQVRLAANGVTMTPGQKAMYENQITTRERVVSKTEEEDVPQ